MAFNASEQLIADHEGFRETPYWDVNAYRTGFGSDTITDSSGNVVPVTKGSSVNRADAERDLSRRTAIFQRGIAGKIGSGKWESLNENQQAALSSIAYNYGSLPDRVSRVVDSGGDVAKAIEGLQNDNKGVNKNRRLKEANIFRTAANTKSTDTTPDKFQKFHDAYNNGKMDDEHRVIYERLVESGEIPQQPKPQGRAPSQKLFRAYNTGQLTPEQKATVDNAIQSGQLVMPELQRRGDDNVPVASDFNKLPTQQDGRSLQTKLQRGGELTARAVLGGLESTLGIAANPVAVIMNQALNDESQIPMLGDRINQVLTESGVAQPENLTEEIVGRVTSAVSSVGGFIGAAKTLGNLASGTIKTIANTFAAQPAAQLTGTGAGELASEAVKEAGGGELEQFGANLLGGITAATAVTGAPRLAAKSLTREALETGEDLAATSGANIRTLTSDVVRPESFSAKTAQQVGERIPFAGTGRIRVAQQKDRIDAVRRLGDRFGAKNIDAAAPDIVKDLANTRNKELTRLVTLKNSVINKSDDVVPVDNITEALDSAIVRMDNRGTDISNEIASKLTQWRDALQNKSLEVVDQIRDEMGSAFKGADKVSVKSAADKVIRPLYEPIKQDMAKFIKEIGGQADLNKWNVANERLSKMIGEMDNTAFKRILNKGEATPETINNMLFSNKTSDVKALFKKLTPAGKTNARSAIVGKSLFDKNGDVVSPDVFLRNIKKDAKTTGIFFSGEDKRVLEGLKRALQVTKRASEAGVSTQSGQGAFQIQMAQLLGLTGTGAGVGGATGAVTALGAAGGVGSLARLYESPATRRLLLALGKVKIQSNEEAAIFKRLLSATQSLSSSKEKENK